MASLTLDWLHIVVLLGALQGVFLTAALATKRRNRTANRLLAAAMLAFSLSLATTAYHAAGLEKAYPHFFGIGYPLTFLFGPLVYLYAVAAADRSRPFIWKDALHLLPFLACVVIGFPIYLQSGPDKIATYQRFITGDVPLWIAIADPLKLVSGAVYTVLTIRFLQRHREQVKDSYSSTERVNLQWLLWLASGAAAIWAMAIGFGVLESTGVIGVTSQDDYIALTVAVLVYAIGYRGMRQPEVFRYETAEYPIVPTPQHQPAAVSRQQPAESPRYERSGLSQREAEKLKESLLAEMDKSQPWKNSELTLADLAEKLATTPHKLSEVLNAELEMTFYDFVNGYRVREVQRRIASGDGKALKILSLALDAGFASKSTFNQVFKKHTGRTPSDFQAA
jgi:AraC-like DNA-binding protein